jgi:cytochrome-b5 reductase
MNGKRIRCFTTALNAMAMSGQSIGNNSSGKIHDVIKCLAPEVKQVYKVLGRRSVSPDSCVLQIGLPPGRLLLGWVADIPTCISIYFQGADEKTGQPKLLSKSYSPISHPATPDVFELLVKGYEYRPGGGVGAYLCGLNIDDEILAKVKAQRHVHGSPVVGKRWKHVGLIAGGTGIAPLFQILQILLQDPDDTTQIHVLSINRHDHDILLKAELNHMANKYPNRLRITFHITGCGDDDENNGNTVQNSQGHRGSVDLVRKALPRPELDDVMVFVCGRDGFVSYWGGPVCRGPKLPDGTKGPKIQGPLLGILKEAGYCEAQVFKY